MTTVDYQSDRVTGSSPYSSITEFFAHERLTQVSRKLTSHTSVSTTFSRDSLGRISSVTYPTGHTITYKYQCGEASLLGSACSRNDIKFFNVESIISNNGFTTQSTTFAYSGTNHDLTFDIESVTSTSPNGESTVTTYQYTNSPPYHLVTSMTQNEIQTKYQYNSVGDLLSIRGPSGDVSMTYDKNGNLLSQTDMYGETSYFGYDSFGNLSSVTDHFGRRVDYSHDDLDRVIDITSPTSRVTRTYGPESSTGYQEELRTTIGAITSTTRFVTSTTEGGIKTFESILHETGGASYRIDQQYDPTKGFEAPTAASISTPTIPSIRVKDDNNFIVPQASPVPSQE